jgi:hypothetical protein
MPIEVRVACALCTPYVGSNLECVYEYECVGIFMTSGDDFFQSSHASKDTNESPRNYIHTCIHTHIHTPRARFHTHPPYDVSSNLTCMFQYECIAILTTSGDDLARFNKAFLKQVNHTSKSAEACIHTRVHTHIHIYTTC